MAFALSQPGRSLEPGFRQSKKPQPRSVFSRHPVNIARERSVDWTDLALVDLVAAISALMLIDGALILVH